MEPAEAVRFWKAKAETWTSHVRAGYDVYHDTLNTDSRHREAGTWWFSTLPIEERQRVAPFRVPRFHRMRSSWVQILCEAGLVIEQFGEPCATAEQAAAEPVLADTRVAPVFLHIRARKPGDSN